MEVRPFQSPQLRTYLTALRSLSRGLDACSRPPDLFWILSSSYVPRRVAGRPTPDGFHGKPGISRLPRRVHQMLVRDWRALRRSEVSKVGDVHLGPQRDAGRATPIRPFNSGIQRQDRSPSFRCHRKKKRLHKLTSKIKKDLSDAEQDQRFERKTLPLLRDSVRQATHKETRMSDVPRPISVAIRNPPTSSQVRRSLTGKPAMLLIFAMLTFAAY